MGSESSKVKKQLHLSDDDRKKYAAVKAQLDAYFASARNALYEICTFRTRKQGEKEYMDAFITSLYTISKFCEFDDRREKEILLQLIVGVRDDRLSRRLQQGPKITLETAKLTAQQFEEINVQQNTVWSSAPAATATTAASLEPISRQIKPKGHDRERRQDRPSGASGRNSSQQQNRSEKHRTEDQDVRAAVTQANTPIGM